MQRLCNFHLVPYLLGLLLCGLANHATAQTPPPQRSAETAFVGPKLVKFVPAQYPDEAKKKRLTGVVRFLLVVDAKGNVQEATPVFDIGNGFTKSALKAVRQFKFAPATYGGKPVLSRVVYNYRFTLKIRKKIVPPVAPQPRTATPTAPVAPPPTYPGQPAVRPAPRAPQPTTPTAPRPTKAATPAATRQNPPVPRRTQAPAPRKAPELRPRAIPSPATQDDPLAWEGYVLQRGSRDPVEGAQLFLVAKGFQKQAITDQNGRYRFPKVPPGRYRVVIPVPNFKRFQKVLKIKGGKDRKVRTWYLSRLGSDQFVSVTRAKRKKQEVYQKTLQREEIEIIPGTQGDPLKVVQNLPGMARTPLNTGFFVVRGSAPEDSRVYLDGHQIPSLYHFGGLTAVVNADIARNIDLIPGGFSVAYGRSTGGVISVNTRKGTDRWHGYLDFDLIDIGFFLEGPLWKGANLMISARRSHLDFFLGLILPETPAFDLTVAPRYYDYQIKLDWQVNKAHNLSFMYFGSRDLLTFLREAPIGGDGIRGEFGFYSMFHRLQLRWRFSPSKSVVHDLSIHTGFSLNDIKGGTTIGFASNTAIIAVRDELRWQVLKNFSIRAGLDVRIRNIALDIRLPTNVPQEGDLPGSQGNDGFGNITATASNSWVAEPGAYLEANWNILPTLKAQAGVRFDYATSSMSYTFDPRLNVTWTTPWKPLSFVAGVGLFSQPPQLQESSETFGNPALEHEHSIHVTLGSNVQWTSYFNTEVTFFYKHMYDLIIRSNNTVERDGQEVPERLRNGGLGRAYGLELLIRHKPHKKFFGWISYTLSRSERQDNPGEDYRLFSFDQSHILTFVAAYKIGWGLSISARFRLVSGNPFTPIRGGIYDADRGNYIPIPGANNSARNPLFHQLDLRIDYKLTFTTWKLMFYLDVQNVYNQPNQEGTTYNYDYSQSAPLTGIPIFPSLGIKGQF
ncbi:MAG: TonB family protein [Deltaproteobacteria bacterium]|nr:MAG: TonB family protein [Deltaproteobacteria bacterium]